MAEPVFTGPFKKEMQDFISLKRSVGYKYNSEPGILKRFDNYLAVHYPETDILSNPHARTLGTTINETMQAIGY